MPRRDIPNITIRRPSPIKISKSRIRRRRLIGRLSLAHERFRMLWKSLLRNINEKRYGIPHRSSQQISTRFSSNPVKSQGKPESSQQTLVLGLEVPDSYIKIICGYCMEDVSEEGSNISNGLKRFVCDQCGCIQHLDCWETYGGCVALGSPH
jgi:hypothetical protein